MSTYMDAIYMYVHVYKHVCIFINNIHAILHNKSVLLAELNSMTFCNAKHFFIRIIQIIEGDSFDISLKKMHLKSDINCNIFILAICAGRTDHVEVHLTVSVLHPRGSIRNSMKYCRSLVNSVSAY